MTEGDDAVRIHVDSDWKTEAAKEKERLATEERKQERAAPGAVGVVNFYELLHVLVMQAMVALGGAMGPGGERIAPNPGGAKYFIDLLNVLADKTKGNLTDEEKKAMDSVLYELRMQYVQTVSPRSASGAKPPAA
jgi:hypothetical protein